MESFRLELVLNTSPEIIYEEWLDSSGHENIIAAQADIKPEIGYEFSMWDGYITGKNLILEEGKKIIQAWRTSEFPPNTPDSKLTLLFEKEGSGSKLVLIHEELQEGDGRKYEQGWKENYFEGLRSKYN